MDTSQPLISTILIVKNGERFLASAIESVLAQTCPPLELIVIDGHSTDRTAEIARSYPLVRTVLQRGKGVADAYNQGIEEARGPLVAFLSHDDLWTPDKLQVQTNYLLAHPETQYTIAMIRFFLEPGHTIPPGFRKELLVGEHVGRIMETLVARREVFDRVGLFDDRFAVANDVDWYARASDLSIPMAIIPQVLLHKRVHNTNTSLGPLSSNRELLATLRSSVARKRAQRETD